MSSHLGSQKEEAEPGREKCFTTRESGEGESRNRKKREKGRIEKDKH